MKIKKYISINRKLLLIYLRNPQWPRSRDGAKVCLERILQAQNVLKHTGFNTVDGKAAVLELNEFKFKERLIRFFLKTRQRSINFFLITRKKLKVAILKLKESRKKKTDAVNNLVTPALITPPSGVLTKISYINKVTVARDVITPDVLTNTDTTTTNSIVFNVSTEKSNSNVIFKFFDVVKNVVKNVL